MFVINTVVWVQETHFVANGTVLTVQYEIFYIFYVTPGKVGYGPALLL